ncbi:MAG: M20 family metallopeptidase [Bacteroidetes bacterium]|nr:M20 family metallopeptidase [Bacteroidota bacterium]MDA1118968.1 M20 family metallopeptidase [Bacteroidota bacterium]
MSIIDEIKSRARNIHLDLIGIRRHIHSNPELSFKEYETSAFIKKELDRIDVQYSEMAGTGIVALIKGKNPESKVVALRADIDALPIVEANDVPYKSQNTGVMHACGHDVHTTSMLGATQILNDLKENFEGSIKIIFQPGEEKLPGGATLMIKEGVLENPTPASIIGQHVMPFIPAGKVGFKSGMYMASADEIYMTIRGKGGHAAMPEHNIDPVLIASHIIVAVQQIVSRNASPKIPSVLSFGKVNADGATNVIPNEVKIEGTFRTLNEEWRARAHEKIKKLAQSLAEGMGGQCDIEIRKGYPFLKNHPEVTQRAKDSAIEYLGQENVLDLDIWMASEDFAWYSQQVDSCFYRLGTGNESKGIISGVHTPTFDIDESALEIGAGLMAWIAIRELTAL